MKWSEKSTQRKMQDVVRWALISLFTWSVLKSLRKIIVDGGTSVVERGTEPENITHPINPNFGGNADDDGE